MAASVTLTTMIQSVRRRANIENQTAFIPDTEITEYLNYGCQEVYDMLVQAGGQPWYRNTNTFSTTANTSSYALPADFYELCSVDIVLSGGGSTPTVSARPYMEFERNRYKYYPGWTSSTPVFYRLVGSKINFIPAPSGPFQVTLNYYPAFVLLVNGSDTFDGVNGWEEYAIWKAVADCKGKGEEDPSYALAQMAKLQEKIQAMASERDTGSPERMTEMAAEYGGPWGPDFGAIR